MIRAHNLAERVKVWKFYRFEFVN